MTESNKLELQLGTNVELLHGRQTLNRFNSRVTQSLGEAEAYGFGSGLLKLFIVRWLS